LLGMTDESRSKNKSEIRYPTFAKGGFAAGYATTALRRVRANGWPSGR
jgi:hypothetical protein